MLIRDHTNAIRVMNAPAVRVLMSLKTSENLVAINLHADIIVSKNLFGLKLKPTKCNFISEEVEYVGHSITSKGLKPNIKNSNAV